MRVGRVLVSFFAMFIGGGGVFLGFLMIAMIVFVGGFVMVMLSRRMMGSGVEMVLRRRMFIRCHIFNPFSM